MNEKKQSHSCLGKPRLLIIGCGDIGLRLLPFLIEKFRVFALTSQHSRMQELRNLGAIPILANLDQASTIKRLANLAQYYVHLAPPQGDGDCDKRTQNLSTILPDKCRFVYISTTGVYGDCGEIQFNETKPIKPHNQRAIRRVSAETSLRQWAVRSHSSLSILRVPGIYAENRLPIERLKKGTPALLENEDVFSNHIHAEDLAKLIYLSLFRARSNRIYHAVDDSDMKMADYFDLVADRNQLPKPKRLKRDELSLLISPVLLSFMSESRRMMNQRMKQELGMKLKYPTVYDGVPLNVI